MLVISLEFVGNNLYICSLASPKEFPPTTLYIFLLKNEFKQIAHTYVGPKQKQQTRRETKPTRTKYNIFALIWNRT
jgi:hypothetical protein